MADREQDVCPQCAEDSGDQLRLVETKSDTSAICKCSKPLVVWHFQFLHGRELNAA